ncbi:MAG: efflux RND transporter permease subunit [Bacteroidales bacterium]|nr:efflux RND transporter permease subunit [Bacteroidales bacterium]
MDFGKWAFENRKLVSLFVALFLVGGVYSYFRMPKLEDPEIIVRQALVVAINPGASAHQNELEVAVPLEKSIRETPGVDFVETHCLADVSYIKVSLATTVRQDDIQQVWDIVRRKVGQTSLPAGVTTQVMDDFGDVYGMFYSISGEGFTSRQLADYVEMIQREIQEVKGVSRVSTFGVPKECIRIQLRQDRLANLGVLPIEVIQTLTGQNANVYSGYYLSGDNRIRVSVDDRYRSAQDIAGLIIQGHEQDQLKLGDIADVEQVEETPVRELMKRDGVRSIGLSISGNSGTDITKVGRDVENKLNELLESRIPTGIQIDKVFNQPDRVNDAMADFMLNLLISVILVILVLVFTMGLRPALIIGATLITTVAGSVLILNYTGGTLQRVSLATFVFAMGMLVDNAIVIVDGILVAKSKGLPKEQGLVGIGQKTAWPLLGATLIAILSFLPIFQSPDVTGLYVHDMFVVLAVSLLLSWLLALTHVPIMAGRWLYSAPASRKDSSRDSAPYRWLKKALGVLLQHRWATVIGVVVLIALAGFGTRFMPHAFFPDMEYDQLYMEYKLPESHNYTQVEQDLDSIQRWLAKRPEVTHVVNAVGGTPSRYNLVRSLHNPSLSYGECIIDFKSPRALLRNYHEIQTELQEMFPDAFIRMKRYNLMFLDYPIQLSISGPDPKVLTEIKDECNKIIAGLGCCECIHDEWEDSAPTMVVRYDQAAARNAGLTRLEVGTSLLASTEGIPVGQYYDGMHQMGIYVGCVDSEGNPLKNLENATVFGLGPDLGALTDLDLENVNSASIIHALSKDTPLSQVSDGLELEWETPVVFRYNSFRTRVIGASPIPGTGTEKARKIIDREISKIELPDGYFFEWHGEKQAEKMSIENLFNYYPLALLIMLAILLLLFRDYRKVGILLCSIPVIFVGVVPAMLISGYGFGFVAIVGTLGLVGMIIKNGIILMDEIIEQTAGGKEMAEALMDASMSRLRPVTMAAGTTILGMIPLLTDAMFGAMAATIIGGLLVGTIIVLLFIPILYSLFHGNKK